jgi:hypothetical protein
MDTGNSALMRPGKCIEAQGGFRARPAWRGIQRGRGRWATEEDLEVALQVLYHKEHSFPAPALARGGGCRALGPLRSARRGPSVRSAARAPQLRRMERRPSARQRSPISVLPPTRLRPAAGLPPLF